MAGYVTCSDYVAKVTYFSENYATRKNNGRGDALREVGRGKPVSNNTKPTPVKVVASEKIPRPLRARDYESAAYCKFPRLLRSKCRPFFNG